MVALVLIILWLIKKGRTRNVVALALIGIIAFSFARQSQIDRLLTVIGAASGEARDNSSELRLVFWGLAWRLFKEHPLLGVGPANFPYYSGSMVEGLPYGQAGHVTHSLWFEMLSAGGLFVTVPFVIMLLRFFFKSYRLARRHMQAGQEDIALFIYTPMFALAALLVASTFLDRMEYEPIFWCIALGCVQRYLWGEKEEAAPSAAGSARARGKLGRGPLSQSLRKTT
jgi:O-antigen ligase